MPGFSEACVSGAHQGCLDGVNCRCACHSHTQQLIAKGPGKPDGRGGIRRKRNKDVVLEMPGAVPAEETVKCGCGNVARAGDNFCRKCGARLHGKECERCGNGGENADVFCSVCGWKYGEKIPEQVPVDTAALKRELKEKLAAAGVKVPQLEIEIPEQEDTVVRLKREAIEKGLLRA